MRFLDLFAGIGGFSLGLERAGMTCVGQVEIDSFCNRVLEKHWPNVKRIKDIHNVTGTEFGTVELVCGGFPCQPFSQAGKRQGKKDDRYLWPEMLRVIRAARPHYVFGENVPGIVNMELDKVLSDLEGEGYASQALNIPACATDAPHKRARVWILAYSIDRKHRANGRQERKEAQISGGSREAGCSRGACRTSESPEVLANSERISKKWQKPENGKGGRSVLCREGSRANVPDSPKQRLEREKPTGGRPGEQRLPSECSLWLPEPGVGRVANGVPMRMDRLKALGNAVVPQVVEIIGRSILEAEIAYKNIEAGLHQPTSQGSNLKGETTAVE